MIELSVASGIGLIAGCIGEEDPDAADDDQANGDDDRDDGDDQDDGDDREVIKDTLHMTDNPGLPEDMDFITGQDTGSLPLLVQNPTKVVGPTGDIRSGHTLSGVGPDGDDITVALPLEDWELIGENDVGRFHLDDRFPYWNGEPQTAKDYYNSEYINYLIDDRVEGDASLNLELVDDYTIDISFDHPQNEWIFREEVHNNFPATRRPDWYWGEYIERLEDATTGEEASEIEAEMSEESFNLHELKEVGHAGGVFFPTDIETETIDFEVWDEHPNADNFSVRNLRLHLARPDRRGVLFSQGDIDLANHTQEPDVSHDHMELLNVRDHPQGDLLVFNWQNEHMARRDFRRALVSVIPFDNLAANMTTLELEEVGFEPVDLQTGMTPPTNREWLDDQVLDELYHYPIEADPDAASEFMDRAGYSLEGEEWVGPDGDVPELLLIAPSAREDFQLSMITVRESLREFGIRVELRTEEFGTWAENLENGNFDISHIWGASELATPFKFLMASQFWFQQAILFDPSGYEPDQEQDFFGRPIEPIIPEQPGALEVENDGIQINVVDLVTELEGPAEEDRLNEITELLVRWFNYDLPNAFAVTESVGIVGNTRDFEWPPEGHDAYQRWMGPWGDKYILEAGAFQPRYE